MALALGTAACGPALAQEHFTGVGVADLSQGQSLISSTQKCGVNSVIEPHISFRLGDLNGDGRADILIRHSNGQWHLSGMNGKTRISSNRAPGLPSSLNWRFSGLADMNDDGMDDVLLRHEDGRWQYYAMNGYQPISAESGIADMTGNRDWRIAGVGDLDGDDKDDVLLRHAITGNWFYFPMNGRNHVVDKRGLVELPQDMDWRIAGIGDLNGDGKDDVLLRHATNGTWHYYPMSGRTLLAGDGVANLPTNSSWKLAGLADLNGDGNDDALMRHDNGTWHYYPMSGSSLLTGDGATDLPTAVGWKLQGLGDLNGDGKDDVVLRNATGTWRYRAMNGSTSITAQNADLVLTTDLKWRVVADVPAPSSSGCTPPVWSCNGATPPAKPSISWMPSNYSIIDVSSSATAYEQLVTVNNYAEVPVGWSKWSGTNGNKIRYLLDDEVVVEASLTSTGRTGSQTGTATLQVAQGGQYDLQVALCQNNCCAKSDVKEIVVADTDGSHVDPITLTDGENNTAYQMTTDAVVAAYFVEWSVYGRNFPVDKVPAYNLTHILYGFIPICSATENESLKTISGSFDALTRSCLGRQDYKVSIHDPWAAVQKPQAGHSFSTPYKGNFGQFMELKKAYPDLKILPSIGGWTLSDPFYSFNDQIRRTRFIDSVEDFLKTWKFFDGVDIDWEYPGGYGANRNLGNPIVDRATYRLLMQELRIMLDDLTLTTGRRYELTSAIAGATDKIARVDFNAVQKYMDYLLVMNYDFYGGWDLNTLGHLAGLYAPSWRSTDTYNAHAGIQALLTQGVSSEKLVMGVPMYGRGWSGVSGWTGTDHLTGTATGKVAGTWEAGVLDYRDIAGYVAGTDWTYHYDSTSQAPYIFKSGTNELVSYDNQTSVLAKGAYVRSNDLGGLFAWEIDADNGDILNAMHQGLGHGSAVANRAPVAQAGVDQKVDSGNAVTLDASASYDLDGDTLSFTWSQTSGTTVTLTNATTATPGFTAPTVTANTDLVFSVSVSDGTLSASDSVTVTVRPPATNTAPVANAGADQTVQTPATVTLDGSASSDADGDTLTYTWTQTVGTTVSLASANAATASFSASAITASEDLTFQLTVSDGSASHSDQTVVTLLPASTNRAPTVSLRATASVAEGASLSITATASDADGDDLTYSWVTGSINATGTNTSTITFVAPQVSADKNVTMTVTVSDGSLSTSASIVVTITDTSLGACRKTDPNAANYPAWDSSKSNYVGGDRVAHKGLVWEAKYWTAQEPVIGETTWPADWTLISDLELPWHVKAVYLKDDEVNHKGRRYRAKWWIQGEEPPGTTGVWVDVGKATCS